MNDTGMRSGLTNAEIIGKIAAIPYWFHRIELAPGIVTPGEDDTRAKFAWVQIPESLSGKRILDIGTYDGYFSFECERRGAEVVAIDTLPYGQSGFKTVSEILGSSVEFRTASIYELNPDKFGYFDLILCLGIIYHLRHPLLGIEAVRSVCRDKLILETQICDRHFVGSDGVPRDLSILAPELARVPMAQFYPGSELNKDPSNWWSPNLPALEGMLTTSGFKIEKLFDNGVRACAHCIIN